MYDQLRMNLPKKPPVIAEVECPSCGSPRATDALGWLNPATGKLTAGHDELSPAASIALLLGTAAVIAWVSNVLIEGFPFWGSIVAGAVAGLGVLIVLAGRAVKREGSAVRVHRYKCVLCDHEWTWREGTPRPRYRYREQIMEEYETLFGKNAGDAEDRH